MAPQSGSFSSYEEAVGFLLSITDNEKRLGSGELSYGTRDFDIQRFRESLKVLGSPHSTFAVIHVAGTKGKGSTCAMAAAALQGGGLSVGLYTSPHLVNFTERIRINGQEISREDFTALVSEIVATDIAEGTDAGGFRTVFDILTAAAFLAFARAGVDVAVVETGLGGRLDSTNVFNEVADLPRLSVITSIGFDHTALLGETITEIAEEKAGIIHDSGPAVLAQQPAVWSADVGRVVSARAAEVGTPFLKAEDLLIWKDLAFLTTLFQLSTAGAEYFLTQDRERAPFAYVLREGFTVELSLHGAHQAGNCAAALMAVLVLEKTAKLKPLKVAGLIKGLKDLCWPGRTEVVRVDPVVMVDGAHCPLSVDSLAQVVRAQFPLAQVHLVCGFLRDKNVGKMLSVVATNLNIVSVHLTAPETPRALSISEAAELVGSFLKVVVHEEPSPKKAVAGAIAKARRDGGIVVYFGSLYLVGEVREAALKFAEG